jgi:hypothetical protein
LIKNQEIKNLTFKISMVYDDTVLRAYSNDALKKNSKRGGDLNDKGGIDRQHWEGGQNLESVS